jgi:hypothetical protein
MLSYALLVIKCSYAAWICDPELCSKKVELCIQVYTIENKLLILLLATMLVDDSNSCKHAYGCSCCHHFSSMSESAMANGSAGGTNHQSSNGEFIGHRTEPTAKSRYGKQLHGAQNGQEGSRRNVQWADKRFSYRHNVVVNWYNVKPHQRYPYQPTPVANKEF